MLLPQQINVFLPLQDGSNKTLTNLGEIGGLIRDAHRNMMSSVAGKITAHLLEAELLALQKGLLVSKDLDISFLQIKGDGLILITIPLKMQQRWPGT